MVRLQSVLIGADGLQIRPTTRWVPSRSPGVLMFATQKPPTYYTGCNEALLRAVPATARRILDVGCGEGLLGARLKEQQPGCTVFGVERESAIAAQAAARLDRVFPLDVQAE